RQRDLPGRQPVSRSRRFAPGRSGPASLRRRVPAARTLASGKLRGMPDIVLAAEPRAERGSRAAGRLRRGGRVPAVVYGLGNEAVTVTVPSRELAHILSGESGANTLIDLKIDGESMLTLARQ